MHDELVKTIKIMHDELMNATKWIWERQIQSQINYIVEAVDVIAKIKQSLCNEKLHQQIFASRQTIEKGEIKTLPKHFCFFFFFFLVVSCFVS